MRTRPSAFSRASIRLRRGLAFLALGASLTGARSAAADSYYFNMDFRNGSGLSADFYATGFPSAQLLYHLGSNVLPYAPPLPAGGDAHCDYTMGVFPLPISTSLTYIPFVTYSETMLNDNRVGAGFSTTSAILFEFQHVDGLGIGSGQESLDDGVHGSKVNSLPTPTRDGHKTPMGDPHASIVPQLSSRPDRASVFLISVDPSSPDFLALYPVTTDFGQSNFCPSVCGNPPVDNLGCGGKQNKLSITPLQGVPLRPSTLYAAVLTDRVTHDGGKPIDMAPGLTDLRSCMKNAACDASHGALATGQASGIGPDAYDQYAQGIHALVTGSSPTYDSASIWPTIRALTVFRTGDPTAGFKAMVEDALANPAVDGATTPFAPAASRFPITTPKGTPVTDFGEEDGQPGSPITSPGVFGEFCVLQANITMPNYQTGAKPYDSYPDGTISFDQNGRPLLQGKDGSGRIFVTIPRKPMPANGYPVVVFERAGGGGDVPMVSRGHQTDHFPVYGWSGGNLDSNVDKSCTWGTDDVCETQPGAGPAKWFSKAGYAGVQIDDPLGGARRPKDKKISEEDDLIFQVKNPGSIRDNVRQAAVELVVLAAKTLPKLTIPASAAKACTVTTCSYSSDYLHRGKCVDTGAHVLDASGQPAIHFDVSSLTLMGHSVGATVSPLALSANLPATGQPFYKKGILSGAGASFLNNLLYKEDPAIAIPFTTGRSGLREAAEAWPFLNRQVNSEGDPAFSVIQWALEAWDAQVYNSGDVNRMTQAKEQFVLQFQGIIDHYIEAPIADAAALSAGYGLGITTQMRKNPLWTKSFDTDPGFYNHGGTTWEWEDNPNYSATGLLGSEYDGEEFSSLTHDWRAFEPLSSLIDLGGFQRSGAFGISNLPQTGKSLVVQVDNAGYAPGTTKQWSSYPAGQEAFEDGHEVVFQHIESKLQYACFLESAVLGKASTPIIPDRFDPPNGVGSPCCPHLVNQVNTPGMSANCSACVNAVCSKNPFCCDTTKPRGWIGDCATLAMTDPACGPND